MRTLAGALTLAAGLAVAPLAAPPAHAECAGLTTVDTCLVGAWRQSGGGAVEWMKRNMPPGMPVPQVNTSGQMIVLNRDGSYWTTPMTAKTTIKLGGSEGALRAEGTMTAQSKGRWSSQSGTLNLCPDEETMNGQMQFTGPGGRRHTMPMALQPTHGSMNLVYRCAGEGLETEMTIPGMKDPMTTRYARVQQ